MKKYLLFLLSLLPLLVSAQYDCSTGRFVSDVFPTFTQTSNIQFGQNKSLLGADTPLLMDIFEPTGDTMARRPLVIWATGGYFLFCDKTEMYNACKASTKRGFVSATITYRLWGEFTVPDSIKYMSVAIRATHDMKAAVRFFKADAAGADLYKVDTTRIFVGGYSAGALMALQATYLDNLSEVAGFIADTITANGGIEGNSGNPGHISSDIAGVISMAGALYRDTIIGANNNIPALFIHGDADKTIPYGHAYANVFGTNVVLLDGSLQLHARMNSLGIPNTLLTVPGGGHSGPVSIINGINWADSSQYYANNFLAEQVCGWQTSLPNKQERLSFHLSPNPSTGVFTLKLGGSQPVIDATLVLYNMEGQEVFRNNGFLFDGQRIETSLSSGLYQAILTTENGQQLREKWVVMGN